MANRIRVFIPWYLFVGFCRFFVHLWWCMIQWKSPLRDAVGNHSQTDIPFTGDDDERVEH